MTAPTWEARVDAAVKAVYADADLRLEALQLDLLEPRPDGTRWTAEQVKDRRIRQAIRAMRDGFREMGQTLQQAFDHVGAVVGDVARAVTEALAATTRDDYTFAADGLDDTTRGTGGFGPTGVK